MNIEINEPRFKIGQRISFKYPRFSWKPKLYIGIIEQITGHNEFHKDQNENVIANLVTYNYKIKVNKFNGYNNYDHYSGVAEHTIEECNEPDYKDYYELLYNYGINLDSGRFILKSFKWGHDKDYGAYYKKTQDYEFQFTDRLLNQVITFIGAAELKDVNKLSPVS